MELVVPFIDFKATEKSIKDISCLLDSARKQPVAKTPWGQYASTPDVSFSLVYVQDALLLKYFVKEESIRICLLEDNSRVHEDSCVEFFIAFNGDENYYNLEFNSAGTSLVGFGKDRRGRHLVPAELISKIRRLSAIHSCTEDNSREIQWEITVIIPFGVFSFHDIRSLKGCRSKGNFYKCGDELPEPHFLSWKEVNTEKPDFHVPACFGDIHFK